ncbi:serine hydrolase [Dankookia rubra]|uniref:Serine hydrolase n=1 Tax=Dankookia rubra TaxID=1442381 RepID=A0A4R5QIX7_9PROT|nr:serine hydrolase [Dankookia rubra]TDH62993.1 serine hydrolase [Dankookia rubra]
MHRRSLSALPLIGLGAMQPAAARAAEAPEAALRRYRALPGTAAYMVRLGPEGTAGRFAHRPNQQLFIASAYKTFVLGQYLRDVEAGRLDPEAQLAVDDDLRSPGSPVLLNLTGTTTARSVLEAMITHSDNTATDIATRQVGADRVRALIAEAGLRRVQIPDSTRIFASYLLGAPIGVDVGWAGLQHADQFPPEGYRAPLNGVQSLAGSAGDLASWYDQALRGAIFRRPGTLREFKRIQAMAVQIARVAPPDIPVHAKGGEVADFLGFCAKSFAGQMVVGGRTPVSFAFLLNWDSAEGGFAEVQEAYFDAIRDILAALAETLA